MIVHFNATRQTKRFGINPRACQPIPYHTQGAEVYGPVEQESTRDPRDFFLLSSEMDIPDPTDLFLAATDSQSRQNVIRAWYQEMAKLGRAFDPDIKPEEVMWPDGSERLFSDAEVALLHDIFDTFHFYFSYLPAVLKPDKITTVIVVARNGNGFPEICPVRVRCWADQFEDGQHYALAKEEVGRHGYEPFGRNDSDACVDEEDDPVAVAGILAVRPAEWEVSTAPLY